MKFLKLTVVNGGTICINAAAMEVFRASPDGVGSCVYSQHDSSVPYYVKESVDEILRLIEGDLRNVDSHEASSNNFHGFGY